MKLFCNLHCYAKTGPVVWSFYQLNGNYIATNGEHTITADNYAQLKQIKTNFLAYKTKSGGQKFYPGLPKVTPTPVVKQQDKVAQLPLVVQDPWESSLPLSLQLDLAAL